MHLEFLLGAPFVLHRFLGLVHLGRGRVPHVGVLLLHLRLLRLLHEYLVIRVLPKIAVEIVLADHVVVEIVGAELVVLEGRQAAEPVDLGQLALLGGLHLDGLVRRHYVDRHVLVVAHLQRRLLLVARLVVSHHVPCGRLHLRALMPERLLAHALGRLDGPFARRGALRGFLETEVVQGVVEHWFFLERWVTGNSTLKRWMHWCIWTRILYSSSIDFWNCFHLSRTNSSELPVL